ncbi:MAG: hypothetical protein DHS20C15_10530 [Planctomycetota bacterium]|nr:MAG: hypothetical protein DHS20C15_10530 [Planctomycetota bacterium]
MTLASTRIAVEFLSRLALDIEAQQLEPLAVYLERYPGHEEVVAEEYLRARRAAQAVGDEEASRAASSPTIGGYQLLEQLGRGGQAVVWKAHDEQLDRTVALKVVQRLAGAQEFSARFRREARVTATLEHPNVCALYDSGADDACAWLAMQYVPGQTLADWLAERSARRTSGRAPDASEIREALALIEKVARALHVAHTHGIVHRDIKPANIMVRPDGEPVILDFGVALLLEEAPQITRTGTSLGTPAYMSPEQVSDEHARVGPATDVWSLGATLYEACCGQRAFPQTSHEALVRAIHDSEPIDPRKLSANVSRDLTAVIQAALCKHLGGRYSTALEFADELRCVQDHRPTRARTLGWGARLARWARRNPTLAAVSAVLLLSVLAASVVIVDRNWALSESNVALSESNAALTLSNTQLATETATAEREALAKTAALAEYERLADSLRLETARTEAAALFPLHPELAAQLESWQARYAPLFARLPLHEAQVAQMRSTALPYSDADRERDYSSELKQARFIAATLPLVAMHVEYHAELVERRDEILARTRERRSWSFGADIDMQFRHDGLSELCVQLAEFVRGEDSVVVDIAERLELCRAMQSATVEQHAGEWSRAIARVAENALYGGLELTLQPGLVPLGADPDSTLEEFLLWESAPDEALPMRGDDGQLTVTGDTGIVLVLIPGGSFLMGAQADDPAGDNYDDRARANEGDVTRVALDAFLLSKFEMTQGQWLAATGDRPSAYYDGYDFAALDASVDLSHPVERVSWLDASATLRRLGLTLPTEAQWEYAGRANTGTRYAGTSEDAQLERFANTAGAEMRGFFPNFSESRRDPFVIHAPVGSFEPNAFGLHDMTGNVWEWTRDRFTGYFVAPAPGDGERASLDNRHLDRGSALGNRVYRGGSSGEREVQQHLTLRTEQSPDVKFSSLGVRPARALRR